MRIVLNKYFMVLWLLFLVHIGYAQSPSNGKYILSMQGQNSIFQVLLVKVTFDKKSIILIREGQEQPLVSLTLTEANKYAGKFPDPFGNFSIYNLLQKKKEFNGKFNFQVNESGKSHFYLEDSGVVKLTLFDKETFNQLKKQIVKKSQKAQTVEDLKKTPNGRKYLSKQKLRMKKGNNPIVFYGKVLDQFGQPVQDAEVEYSIKVQAMLMWSKNNVKVFRAKTNKQGEFKVQGKGEYLRIRYIRCSGYRKAFLNKSYYYYGNKLFIPNKKKAIVFLLSKITDKATYLYINRKFDFDLISGESKNYSVFKLKRTWCKENDKNSSQYEKEFLAKYFDLHVEAIFDIKKYCWFVTFSTSDKNGGFLLTEKLLNEAPKDGFTKVLNITQYVAKNDEQEKVLNLNEKKIINDKCIKISASKLIGKFLYIKSRDPVIFSRMKIKDYYIDEEKFRLFTTTETNPYGNNNLEVMEVPYGMGKSFYPKIIEALLAGKRPVKPDIKKIWEEYKKSHEQFKNAETGEVTWKKK